VSLFREYTEPRMAAVFGDWDRRPPGPGRPELIFVAVRA